MKTYSFINIYNIIKSYLPYNIDYSEINYIDICTKAKEIFVEFDFDYPYELETYLKDKLNSTMSLTDSRKKKAFTLSIMNSFRKSVYDYLKLDFNNLGAKFVLYDDMSEDDFKGLLRNIISELFDEVTEFDCTYYNYGNILNNTLILFSYLDLLQGVDYDFNEVSNKANDVIQKCNLVVENVLANKDVSSGMSENDFSEINFQMSQIIRDYITYLYEFTSQRTNQNVFDNEMYANNSDNNSDNNLENENQDSVTQVVKFEDAKELLGLKRDSYSENPEKEEEETSESVISSDIINDEILNINKLKLETLTFDELASLLKKATEYLGTIHKKIEEEEIKWNTINKERQDAEEILKTITETITKL